MVILASLLYRFLIALSKSSFMLEWKTTQTTTSCKLLMFDGNQLKKRRTQCRNNFAYFSLATIKSFIVLNLIHVAQLCLCFFPPHRAGYVMSGIAGQISWSFSYTIPSVFFNCGCLHCFTPQARRCNVLNYNIFRFFIFEINSRAVPTKKWNHVIATLYTLVNLFSSLQTLPSDQRKIY